jgi:hypothetical protein
MHGVRGTRRRRLIILIEFVSGVVVGAALGVWALTWGGPVGLILGVWLLGLSANYVPLAWNVVRLFRPGRLEAELAGADLLGELRHYTRAQVWVLVPFWIAVLALAQVRRAN